MRDEAITTNENDSTGEEATPTNENDAATDDSDFDPTPDYASGDSGGVMMPLGVIGLAALRRRINRTYRHHYLSESASECRP